MEDEIDCIMKLIPEEIGLLESDVIEKIILPWLIYYGHSNRILREEQNIDIFIDYPNFPVIIEVKKLSWKLDNNVFQIKRYDEKIPSKLMLLSNGDEFFFFSSQWNRKSYSDKLILYFIGVST